MARRFVAIAAQIDALTLKERVLVLLAALLAMFALWYYTLMEPLAARQRELEARLPQLGQSLANLEQQSTLIVEAAKADPDAAVRLRVEKARQQMAVVEARIQGAAGRLVAPGNMAEVLESVLGRFEGLQFVSLEGLGASPLVEEPAPPKGAPPAAAARGASHKAFRHGLRIRFSGGYLDTLKYLQALESLPWGFFWDSVELEVVDYPVARSSIVVYTLSLERGWIGV